MINKSECVCDKYQCPKCIVFGTMMQFHICNPYGDNCDIFIPKEKGEGLDINEIVELVKKKIIKIKKIRKNRGEKNGKT